MSEFDEIREAYESGADERSAKDRETIRRLRSEVKALRAVVAVAEKIRDKRDAQNAHVAKMQALAVLARTDPEGAKAQLRELDRSPRVFEFGNVVDELCEALLALEGK